MKRLLAFILELSIKRCVYTRTELYSNCAYTRPCVYTRTEYKTSACYLTDRGRAMATLCRGQDSCFRPLYGTNRYVELTVEETQHVDWSPFSTTGAIRAGQTAKTNCQLPSFKRASKVNSSPREGVMALPQSRKRTFHKLTIWASGKNSALSGVAFGFRV